MRLAARGLRDLDGGAEPIPDPAERERVRRRGRRVTLASLGLAAALTALALLV